MSRFRTGRKALAFFLCLALFFQWIPVTDVYADSGTTLTADAGHSAYIGNTDPIKEYYGKGDYLYSTLTVTGDILGSEKVFSVRDLETLAYQSGSSLGYEGNYSFKNSGGSYSSQVMTGIKLYDFLVAQCGMPANAPDTTQVKYVAKDGYTNSITVGELKSGGYSYYQDGSSSPTTTGLPVLISFGSNSLPLVGPTGDESVSKNFTAAEGYSDTAQNGGGPLKITIGQTGSGDYNAMLNGKWISRIVVGADPYYTKHSEQVLTGQALTVKVYEGSASSPAKTKNYTLGELENFALSSSANAAKNYYADGNYYEGVNLWSLISKDTDLALSSYNGNAVLKYENGETDDLVISYFQNAGGNYQSYITSKSGSTITCVKPILAYSRNGAPTADNAVYACLPSDETNKDTGTVNKCAEICLYIGTQTDTHNSQPYSDYINQAIEITGSGIKIPGSISTGGIEQKISLMFSGQYTQNSQQATYGGINLYRFLQSRKLTVDAENIIIHNSTNHVVLTLSQLKADSDATMLAFSKNGAPLVPNASSDGYNASSANSGGPISFVSGSQYLENVTSIEVTRKAGQWNHFDGNASGYESYLDTATIRIHGSQCKKDTTLTLRQLEGMTDDIVRDSFAAGGGSFGFEGVILKNLIQDYLISGAAKPTKITVIGSGGFQKELNVDDVYNGIESQYQSGEIRDVILAYGVDGVPLVPTCSSIGYVNDVNGHGPVRLVVENTISAWVKGVSEIVIGSADSENVDYTVSYFQTKARASNSNQQVPGLGYTSKAFSGSVGSSVTIAPPDVPGWRLAGYDDNSGTFHRTSGGAIQITLAAVESQNTISLRYNINAGFLVAGNGLTKNYWYSYNDLLDMAEKAADYNILNAANYYTTNLYSVLKRGGVPADMFGAGIDLSELLTETGGTGSQKVTLYSADGGTSNYGGAGNLYNFAANTFTDQGYYYYPDVLANGTGASAAGQAAVRPMLAFKVKDVSWLYSNLDDKGAPTSSSQLMFKPTFSADVQPVKDRMQSGTENMAVWDDSPAYPYPFLMTGQSSTAHFNNTDYFKMVHGIAVGSMENKLTISASGGILKTYDPMTFAKNGFEPVPFSTNREGISLSRLLTLYGTTLKSGEIITFSGQASSVANATSATLGDYYLTLNASTVTKELDQSSPFIVLHKKGSSTETAAASGLVITAAGINTDTGTGGGGAAGPELPAAPQIKKVELTVDGQVKQEADAVSVKTIAAVAVAGQAGSAQADVKERDISDTLKEVLTARGTASDGVIAEVKLKIDSEKGTERLTVNLPASSLKDIATKENTRFTLATDVGELQFTGEILNEILKQTNGLVISLGLSQIPAGSLPENADPERYSRGVFDLSIHSDGKAITNFGDSQVTASLPYKLAGGEKAGGVFAYYIDNEGNAEILLNSQYNEKTGKVVFQTKHFSYYAVGYDENVIQQVFKDVSSSNWAASAIGYVAGKGLFQGVSDTGFAPQGTMTRGMFVTVLSRLSGKKAATGTENFTDVKPDQWYADSVGWAANAGIVTGYANKTFDPDQLVTREQMASFLYRYAKWAGYDVKVASVAGINGFSDSGKVSPWAKDALIWAVDRGLMSGITGAVLDPQGKATRAQVAVISQRFCDKIVPVAAVVNSSPASSVSGDSSKDTKKVNPYEEVPKGKPYLTIKGSGVNDTIYLTYDDLDSMDTVTITYTGRNKENSNKRQYLTFNGVNLATILNAAGWNGTGKTMKVICTDGYTRKYSISELMDDYVSFVNDEDTKGYWVPPIVALVDKKTFRLVFGQELTDTDTTMSFNMQGWANYLETIEID